MAQAKVRSRWQSQILFVDLVTSVSLLLLFFGEELQYSLALSLIFCGFQ